MELYKDSATDTITFNLRENGEIIVPDSGSVDFYRGGLLIKSVVVTPSSDGIYSIAPGAEVTDGAGENLRAEWTFTTGTTVRKYNQLFDVVLNKIYPVVAESDLVRECSALAGSEINFYGIAESGTTKSLVDNQLIGAESNYWRGSELEFLTGANIGKVVIIDAFNGRTGALSWTTALTAVSALDEFVMKRTFQPEINRAWEDIINRIKNMGNRPNLIMNPESLKTVHVFLSLEKVCRGLSSDSNDIWSTRANHYEKAFVNNWDQIKFLYDTYEDNTPDEARINITGFRR